MVTYIKLQQQILKKLQDNSTYLGVDADNIMFGGQPAVPPCIHIALIPVKQAISRQAPMLSASLEVFVFVEGSPTEQTTLNRAVYLAQKVLYTLNSVPQISAFNGMEVVQFVNKDGQMTYSDRCALVLSWDCAFQFGVDDLED